MLLVLINESTKETICEALLDDQLVENINFILGIDDTTPEEQISQRWKTFVLEAFSRDETL